MPDARSGSLVYRLDPLAPAAEVLAEGDVVTEVDGVTVADDGTVSFRHEERVEFSHLIRCKHIGAPRPHRASLSCAQGDALLCCRGDALLCCQGDALLCCHGDV